MGVQVTLLFILPSLVLCVHNWLIAYCHCREEIEDIPGGKQRLKHFFTKKEENEAQQQELERRMRLKKERRRRSSTNLKELLDTINKQDTAVDVKDQTQDATVADKKVGTDSDEEKVGVDVQRWLSLHSNF